MIYEMEPQFFAYVIVGDTFKCMIGKFHQKFIDRHLMYKIYV